MPRVTKLRKAMQLSADRTKVIIELRTAHRSSRDLNSLWGTAVAGTDQVANKLFLIVHSS